jgi:hypothetical protein
MRHGPVGAGRGKVTPWVAVEEAVINVEVPPGSRFKGYRSFLVQDLVISVQATRTRSRSPPRVRYRAAFRRTNSWCGDVVLSDDAGQFNIGRHASCWIHAERLVHKLDTFNDRDRAAQTRVRDLVWDFYADLKAY